MMSNKIKSLIKDFPTIGEKVLNLYYENKEMGAFAVSVSDYEDLVIHITNIPKAIHNAKEWRALTIADHIHMAATTEHKPTLNDISEMIDKILHMNIISWDMSDED